MKILIFMQKSLSEIHEIYDLEIERIIKEIKKQKAKRVLLQLPDGLKPYATTFVNELKEQCKNVSFLIWFGTCYGACDIPNVKHVKPKIDLIIQFGHSARPFFSKSLSNLS